MSENQFIVEVKNITKRFGNVVALDDVSLKVEGGEFLILLGPSGCGKTTLLRIIGGFETPTNGQVFIDGLDVRGVAPFERDTSMVFQNFALFPHKTVAENVAFGLRMRHTARRKIEEKVYEIIELVGLEGLEKRRPHQLSGGQQQRVALARSLVIQPAVLLLDEPLGALDAKIRKQMQLELKKLQRTLDQTFIYVTHDQEEAMLMSDKVVVMSDGRIMQMGKPEDIYRNPKLTFVASFLGNCNLFEGKVSDVGDDIVCFCTPGCGVLRARVHWEKIYDFPPSPQTPATLIVRPEEISITTSKPDEKENNCLPGAIEEIIYTGSATRCIVSAAASPGVRILAEEKGQLRHSVGEQIWVSWPVKESIVIYE